MIMMNDYSEKDIKLLLPEFFSNFIRYSHKVLQDFTSKYIVCDNVTVYEDTIYPIVSPCYEPVFISFLLSKYGPSFTLYFNNRFELFERIAYEYVDDLDWDDLDKITVTINILTEEKIKSCVIYKIHLLIHDYRNMNFGWEDET